MLDIEFKTVDEGIEKLKDTVSIRNQMGGALYWNICNDDCLKLADNLIRAGAAYREVKEILK